VGPTAPGSWPPWPASMEITSGRVAPLAAACAALAAAGCAAAGSRCTGVGTPVATVVGTACRGDGSLDGCGRCGDAVDGAAGAVAPAAGRFAIRREVASADARAGSGAGAAAAGPATAAPVEPPDWVAAAIC